MMAIDAHDFGLRLESFRNADEDRHQWMETILARVTELEKYNRIVYEDLERERVAGRTLQEEVKTCATRFDGLQKSVDRGSFVLVLIDADADQYIFDDAYYAGVDGGRRAALDLQAAVRGFLERERPEAAMLPIDVRAFANEDGLSRTLVRARIARSPDVLLDFAKGFSQANANGECDFVFVGSGKDRADTRIGGVFERFIKNPTCRHVLFAACHDNSYVRLLEKYEVDDSVSRRVTLVYSFDAGREFHQLRFPTTRLPTIFRSGRLEHLVAPPAPNGGPPSSLARENGGGGGGGGGGTSPVTWASRARAAGDAGDAAPSPRKMSVDQPFGPVLVNAAGQRVDGPLQRPPQADQESWRQKTRVDNKRYCRLFYLLDSCRGGRCDYLHNGVLTDGEKLEFRHVLRREACRLGLPCRDARCFYGHNCTCRQHGRCAFNDEMHNVDKSTAKPWTKP